MRSLFIALALFASAAFGQQVHIPGPGIGAGAAAAFVITPDQAWVAFVNGTASNVTPLVSNNLAGAPADGSIAVVAALCDTTHTLSIFADTFLDSGGGSWASAVSIVATSGGIGTMYIFWRTIGTGAVLGHVSISASGSTTAELTVGTYAKSGGTWSTDGTASANDVTNNFGTAMQTGNFTTTMNNGLWIGFLSNGIGQANAGSGFTKEVFTNSNNSDAVLDNNLSGTITGTAGASTNITSVTGLSNRFFGAVGVAFKAQ